MPYSRSEAHLYALPWIALHKPLAFGSVELAPAETCLDSTHPCTEAARLLLGCYQGLDGRPVKPAVMWVAGVGPLGLDGHEHPVLERHRMTLAAGLVIASHYYTVGRTGLGATTNSHCEGYFHRFAADGTHVSIYKRNREGWFLDGWPQDRLRITVPLPASTQHQLPFDRSLCDALVTEIESGSDLGDRLARALPPFLQGNSLNNTSTLLDDMVWMGAAFERLLAVEPPNVGVKLANAVETLLSGATENQTSWTPISQAGNPMDQETGPWRRRWIREFYRMRSVLHSGQDRAGDWTDQFHVVIAAEVFSLSVLRLLADAGLRPLSSTELARVNALDTRIESLAARPTDIEAEWSRCYEVAAHWQVVHQMTDALRSEQ